MSGFFDARGPLASILPGWAGESGWAVSSSETFKAVSDAILTGGAAMSSEFPLPDSLPAGLMRAEAGEIGIYIGICKREPFNITLRLIPKILCLGVGCRRGASAEAIRYAVERTLDASGIDLAAVSRVASIDVKRDEPGLLAFAGSLGVPVRFYSAGELQAVEGDFAGSDFVRRTVGVDNVCERAAVRGGGRLIIRKTAINGVTAAAAVDRRGPKRL